MANAPVPSNTPAPAPLKSSTIKPMDPISAAGKAPLPDPNAPEPKAWAFTYAGPVAPVDDRNCGACNAAAMKKCPNMGDPAKHGSKPEDWAACTMCYAARTAHCPHHCGIAVALGAHTHKTMAAHVIHAEQQEGWDQARTHVAALIAGLSKDVKSVYVKAHADQDQPDSPFSRVLVEVTAYK